VADPFKVSSLSVSRGCDHRLVQCIGHAVKQTRLSGRLHQVRFYPGLLQLITASGLFLPLLAVLGYVFSMTPLFAGKPFFIQMALPTLFLFVGWPLGCYGCARCEVWSGL
jgi:uncharacterized RDD family membrane protein YckC